MNNNRIFPSVFFVPPCLRVILFFGLIFFPALLFAQTAAEVEALLDQKTVTCAQAAYFVLATALEQPPADADEAFALAKGRGWLPAKAQSSGAVTMGGLSLLMMKAFELKSGLMYTLTGSQRYAYREMTDRGFIPGRSYSTLKVSGEQFFQILGNVIAEVEETK